MGFFGGLFGPVNAYTNALSAREAQKIRRDNRRFYAQQQAAPTPVQGDEAMRTWTIAAVTSLQQQVDGLRAELEALRNASGEHPDTHA